jgi:cytochrome c553
MNTNVALALFLVIITGLIWAGIQSNDPSWTGNKNQCVGECYEDWKEANGGGVAATEQAKQAALAAASPEALGESYYGQCVACHGANGQGGIGPQLQGQAAADIASKLTAYRSGEQRGSQSALMWPVAKPMSDSDIDNLAAYISSM